MSQEIAPQGGKVVAFMDIGTNSVRLLAARVHPDEHYTVLTDQKEMVRLGEGGFEDRRLQPEVIDRCVLVCAQLAEMARAMGAEEIVAVATSASREALNRDELLERLQADARLDVRVVSGKEEARLVHLGVSSGMNLGNRIALFMDIGGGSTELIVGGQRGYLHLDSLRLGAMRVSFQFLKEGGDGPVDLQLYERMKRYIRHKAARSIQRLRAFPFELAVGSSGTIMNLAAVAHRMSHKENGSNGGGSLLTRPDLLKVVEKLCALTLEERRKVPGLNPRRADIVIGGAAILDALMEMFDLREVRVSDRTLRNGLVMDYVSREESSRVHKSIPFRTRMVMQLGRAFGVDEAHARRVSRFALQLFDSSKRARLHRLGARERELLEYSADLHDIGACLSYTSHHAHGAYFIRNAELLGFDHKEVAIIAATVFYHRKGLPKAKNPTCDGLDDRSLKVVSQLSILLRLAESLNRGRSDVVRRVGLMQGEGDEALLEIDAAQDCPLEQWGVNAHGKSFGKVFERALRVSVRVGEPVFSLDSGPDA